MDLEANKILLPPEVCQACILRRRQKTTRRTFTLLIFIAYNILVISVVCFTFWCFNERLLRNEKNLDVLLKQHNALDTEQHSLGVSPAVDATQTGKSQDHKENTDFINIIESARRRREASTRRQRAGGKRRRKKCKADNTGVRKERTVSSTTPHFYLKGHERGSNRATSNGLFMWSFPPYRLFDRTDYFSASDISNADRSFTKVMIHQAGVYFVFAKVTANGRSRMRYTDPPPVGIVLKRESINGDDENLDISWVTQDDRGHDYGRATHNSQETNYPMDSITVSGLYILEVNDKIYIQVPEETINRGTDRFLGENLKARFGAFLVETRTN